jgi:hypothetical protein
LIFRTVLAYPRKLILRRLRLRPIEAAVGSPHSCSGCNSLRLQQFSFMCMISLKTVVTTLSYNLPRVISHRNKQPPQSTPYPARNTHNSDGYLRPNSATIDVPLTQQKHTLDALIPLHSLSNALFAARCASLAERKLPSSCPQAPLLRHMHRQVCSYEASRSYQCAWRWL